MKINIISSLARRFFFPVVLAGSFRDGLRKLQVTSPSDLWGERKGREREESIPGRKAAGA